MNEIRIQEKKAITLAEQNELEQAFEELSVIIKDHPSYASAYNNRFVMK